jgi:hypothetical protein
MMRFTTLFILVLISLNCIAQKDSLKSFKVNAYLESYYSYDFSKPFNNEKPDFNYNYKKHNQPNINLAFVKANYQSKQLRSNLALMTGNYAMYNLSSEPNWAKPLLEANVGYKPFEKHEFWIDAGVMPSHIGFESAVGSDCWNLTRSILAENSPYYESGIKFNYTNKKQDLYIAFHVLNGWQKIAIPKGEENPSVGVQVNYKPSSSLTLNYSNFVGNIKVDSTNNALRIFHNLYAIYDASSRLSFIFGFDIGTQKSVGTKTAIWYTPVIISKINLTQKSKIAGRLEFYSDKQETIIRTSTPNGYQTLGASFNYDYQISPKFLWRSELKRYNSKDPIFKYTQNSSHQTTATMALIVKL